MACGIAELIASEGSEVEVATWWRYVGWDMEPDRTIEFTYEKLMRLGVKLTPHVFVKEILDDRVNMRNVYGGEETLRTVDAVVLVSPRLSENKLAGAAGKHVSEVHVVGEAIAPDGAYTSIFEAHRLGRRI